MKSLDSSEHTKQTKNSNRAAMYVRMSTEQQKYSTENQTDAIREYATKRGLKIVARYADKGKSGLNLMGRHALQRLIRDVESGAFDFEVILVLDVTRWGRFQDTDESGAYEFICRNAGVNVQYVAEPFENDGSVGSNLIKSVKRVMAGEYSRELSKKVFAGQCRLIKLGYRQGGPAGFGLRRMLVDEFGRHKFTLNSGEQKSLQTDRVILVPGPEYETKVVRWMYHKFTKNGWTESKLADDLNQRGILTDMVNSWTRGTVHQVLTNEKYIGNNIFNRTSNKLKIGHVTNEEEMWVRADGAFEAIVPQDSFNVAKKIIYERNRRLSDEEMLERLQSLHQRTGWLSGFIINEQSDMPSSGAYQHRFGSLLRAYQLVGYTPERDYSYIEINRYLRKLHVKTVDETILKISEHGARVELEGNTGLLHINNELSVSIVIGRCTKTASGASRWKIHFDSGLQPDLSIAIRMDAANQLPLDYYLFPFSDIKNSSSKIRLMEKNGLEFDAFQYDSLEPFFEMTERTDIREVA
jgi:DNA invertase Pin-like site-specific DNA recombinase